jgi:hypothetical protein
LWYLHTHIPDNLVLPQLGVILEQPDAQLAGVVELSVLDQVVQIATTDLASMFIFKRFFRQKVANIYLGAFYSYYN